MEAAGNRKAADTAKGMLFEAILENLQIENHLSQGNAVSNLSFSIADLGCSVGPNTFIAVKNIIDTVTQKFQIEGQSSSLPEFHVYFNDHVSNDFNTLFANLSPDRQYFSVGVPGSFYGRLFPKASLNFVYSAYSVIWLSKAPEAVGDLDSPICNRGRICYSNAPIEVGHAYSLQYAKDIKCFLDARAEELAPGGLMVLLISGRPDGTLPAECSCGPIYEPVEACLIDMANEGLISKDKLDSFNYPTYSPSMEELRELIHKNGCFEIARLEEQPRMPIPLSKTAEVRAGMESLLTKHFGTDIMEPLCVRYSKKIEARPRPFLTTADDGLAVGLFVLLKRKH
ncbi:loganic acid O-methyltransferase-like [Pyrus x bretschneideri]|uniref:loganic acid O-methyltransferase-like n=1 Tax=Pyrus x bretschneideri TaxID=225117 RepID=UPI00202FEC96|nr:loganic acid O-methyltransferase-like [Pyrus x bretschneideri]